MTESRIHTGAVLPGGFVILESWLVCHATRAHVIVARAGIMRPSYVTARAVDSPGAAIIVESVEHWPTLSRAARRAESLAT